MGVHNNSTNSREKMMKKLEKKRSTGETIEEIENDSTQGGKKIQSVHELV